MIYGTPGETDDDVRATLEAVLAAEVDHVSAYSLIVEDGTAMARKVRRGELQVTDEDVLASRYALIDGVLSVAGFDWYEVSNWARPDGECRHNLGYWRDYDWWGAGPGAHSHLGDRRFFNVKHPARYTQHCTAGALPIAEEEHLSPHDRHVEKVMLGLRLREGIAHSLFGAGAERALRHYQDQGLLTLDDDRVYLTESGRLLADGIIADVLIAEEE